MSAWNLGKCHKGKCHNLLDHMIWWKECMEYSLRMHSVLQSNVTFSDSVLSDGITYYVQRSLTERIKQIGILQFIILGKKKKKPQCSVKPVWHVGFAFSLPYLMYLHLLVHFANPPFASCNEICIAHPHTPLFISLHHLFSLPADFWTNKCILPALAFSMLALVFPAIHFKAQVYGKVN